MSRKYQEIFAAPIAAPNGIDCSSPGDRLAAAAHEINLS